LLKKVIINIKKEKENDASFYSAAFLVVVVVVLKEIFNINLKNEKINSEQHQIRIFFCRLNKYKTRYIIINNK
jgi:hypothetical protein